MTRYRNRRGWSFFAIALSFLLSSCAAMDYRAIQAQFDRAAQIDNGNSASAYTEATVFTEPGYDVVLQQLTPAYINALDQRLRPNAWLLRAVSQWRTGRLEAARNSARMGLAEPDLQEQSRDKVILLMIPGLVIDAELEKQWKAAGRTFTATQYAEVGKNYCTIFGTFDIAEAAMGPATPPSIRHYLSYQRWRVLQGWRSVINSIDSEAGASADDEQRRALDNAADCTGGKSLKEMAGAMAASIPQGHPLRELMSTGSRP
jgi:hypothetical protein